MNASGLLRTSIDLPFEDTVIAVPSGYDEYLRMEFGNYMQLPPEEKRKNHSEGSLIDLNRPFSYYLEHKELVKC